MGIRTGIPSNASSVRGSAPRGLRPARPFGVQSGPAELPDAAVQMKRAELFGHRFPSEKQEGPLAAGTGAARAMPGDVRSRMEEAFGADFSEVTIHEGGEAPALGAVAFTRGESMHFAPGKFQPHSSEGRKLLGHELAHVIQQREGRVKPTARMQGMPVNLDGNLEMEAGAVGAQAARGVRIGGAPWNGAGAPGRATGQPVVQGLFGWLWDLLGLNGAKTEDDSGSEPDSDSDSDSDSESESELPVKLKLPKAPFTGDRPKKPDPLTGKKDSRNNPLTASHKYPWNQIKGEANDTISTGNRKSHKNLEQWAQRDQEAEIGVRGLAWTPHNIFFTPLPEHRVDDPKENLDTHFTKSGNVTPRSELALDVENAGGIGKIDPEELSRRLEELREQNLLDASGYESDEWSGPPKKRYQKGQPKDWQTKSTKQKVQYAKNHSKRQFA